MGLKNKDGADIKDVWKDGIRTYLGMTFNGFPNAFMVYTPHGMCEVFVFRFITILVRCRDQELLDC